MKISKNFSREEFGCQCGCGFDTVDVQLVEVLQDVREHFGRSVTVTSGCRCSRHNKNIGGSEKSQHVDGRAADFKVAGITPKEVYEYLDSKYEWIGLGLYSSWVHVDSRGRKARW